MVPGVIRCGELESEVRFPRTTMVARQPIHLDFVEKGLSLGSFDVENSNPRSVSRGPAWLLGNRYTGIS